MSRDPYAPPNANVQAPHLERGSAVKAVLVGLAADIGGTMAFGFLATLAYAIYLGATGASPEQMQSTMTEIPYDSALGIVFSIVGCLFSVLGGYLCARIARHSEYRLGLVMCAASLAIIALSGTGDTPPIIAAFLVLVTLAAIMAGVHLGVRVNRIGRRT